MYDIASWMRHGNTLFDAMFYNIANLSAEARCLAIDEGILEGEILVVWPRSRGGPARRYRTVDDLLDPKDGLPGIAHVAVAGVGSSALGAMSLAQDIAEVVDSPVAGVVAGRGVWDWVFEGLEGFWVLGPPDQTGARPGPGWRDCGPRRSLCGSADRGDSASPHTVDRRVTRAR